MKFKTKTIHSGRVVDSNTGSIVPPIHQTATYVLDEIGKTKGFDYSRSTNPSRQYLEKTLSDLENGKHAVCYSSGLSAVDACFKLLSGGDHIVSTDDVYGGVSRMLDQILSRFDISVTYVDTTNADLVTEAIKSNTKMLWIETPTNPLLKVTDLSKMSEIAKSKNLILGVDSTFATPYYLKPLDLGADIVVHSTTKYLSGHNSIIGGVCVVNDDEIHKKLKFLQKSIGAVPSPFDCWLTQIGIKTLAVRMDKHSENAIQVAKFLESHPKVDRVIYPGLESHPQYHIAKEQMSGFSGMISITLKSDFESTVRMMNSFKLFSLAESLGAVESMVTHPASMTHPDVPKEVREARGLTDGLVRLSIGIEDVDDIIEDLKQALDKV